MKLIRVEPKLLVYLTAIVLMVGCEDSSTNANEVPSADAIQTALDSQKTSSAHHNLTIADVAEFQSGRGKSEVLRSVNWRGDLVMLAELDGTPTSAILYNLVGGDLEDDDAASEIVYAIFEHDKFVKWVMPELDPFKVVRLQDGREDIDDAIKRTAIRMGDARALRLLAEAKPASAEELQQVVNNAEPSPRQIDPGLTAVVLGMKALGIDPIRPYPEDYRLNAQLRDQFNASRLRIGMTQQEIDELFKSKPLAKGKVKGKKYVLYGKFLTEAMNVKPGLNYANVLTLFDDSGHLTWAIRVGPYEGWRETFDDFSTSQ